jgi:hypothetical protein
MSGPEAKPHRNPAIRYEAHRAVRVALNLSVRADAGRDLIEMLLAIDAPDDFVDAQSMNF